MSSPAAMDATRMEKPPRQQLAVAATPVPPYLLVRHVLPSSARTIAAVCVVGWSPIALDPPGGERLTRRGRARGAHPPPQPSAGDSRTCSGSAAMSLDGSVARPGDSMDLLPSPGVRLGGRVGQPSGCMAKATGSPTPARSAFFWHITGRDESECPAEKRPSRRRAGRRFRRSRESSLFRIVTI